MKRPLFILFALALAACSRLNSEVQSQVSSMVESFIDEGHCWVEANFGTEATHETTIEHFSVSSRRVFVSTNTSFRNQKGHFLDLFMVLECNLPNESRYVLDVVECRVLTTVPTPDIEMNNRMIPTPPTKNCEGF